MSDSIGAGPCTSSSAVGNDGYLSFKPTDTSSAEIVVQELDLLLTAGRLDNESRAFILTEYRRALNLSSCPVERSTELCGRLTPGDTLYPGERLTNAFGELMYLTYDGVARHIGADGLEVFSTAQLTRGGQTSLRYCNPN